MGCTVSKLDNEDTVRRCKERRRLIKDAVFARHHLAAAHADYCRSLRHTGVALSDFASGEPLLVVSPSTPSVLLPQKIHHKIPKSPSSLSSNYHSTPHPVPPPIKTHFHPPPPPPFSPTVASSKMPPILSASNSVKRSYSNQKVNENHTYNDNNISGNTSYNNSVNARNFFSNSVVEKGNTNNNNYNNGVGISTRKGMKLPHILSDSSVSSSTPRSKFDFMAENNHATYVGVPNTNYCSTPSQASSVWNWDNFYPPPSPPGSDFFGSQNQRKDEVYSHIHHHQHQGQNGHFAGGGGGGGGEEESEREEVHCSEWGDHYSTTSSSSDDGDDGGNGDDDHQDEGVDGDGDDERDSRSEISEPRTRSRSHFGSSSVRSEAVGPPPPLKKVDERSEDGASSSKSWKNTGREMCGSDEMRIMVRHKDLQEIVDSLKDYFDKAAEAGDQVSEMLETGRAQLDRSFRQLKKTVYHSSGVLSSLSSSWTSKPPLAVKYRLDTSTLDAPGGSKSLCSTLERLLAWEKKLYEEVKAREGVKIEHEKKLATLQNQECKGDEVKLDKTKASIKKLQSLIIVTSQAVNTTSSAIVGLRDSDLIPQLVELCHGMMYMWRTMNQYHEVQNQIVQQVRGLVNRLVKGESTSELHRQATRDLESAVSAWHSSFCRLIKFQRDFVRSLHGWFKLTLLPVEKETTNMIPEASDAYPFFDEWKNSLDRLPDTVTSEAIKSFINVVHVISVKQTEEFKIQKRTETISKELEKKASNLRALEKKFYNSYSMVGIGMPDSGPDNGHILDARDPLLEKKAELQVCQRRVEDEMMKHSKAVEVTKAMTLNNLQTGLPGVFQSLTSFSLLFMEGLEAVCTRSYAIK